MMEADILASTYIDKVDVSRYTTIKKPNGATSSEFSKIYTGISCAVSKAQNGAIYEEATNNSSTYNMTLFAGPSTDIALGDTLTVTHFNGKTSEFIAGSPLYYQSHVEVPMTRKVVA